METFQSAPVRFLSPKERMPAANGQRILLWVDPNIDNPGNTKIHTAARQCGVEVHAVRTMAEVEGFIRDHPQLLTAPGSQFRVMTNMVELSPKANDFYAGQSRAERLRHEFALHAPIMIFCGSPERGSVARAIASGTIMTKDEGLAKLFACFMPYHGFGYTETAMFPDLVGGTTGGFEVGPATAPHRWSFGGRPVDQPESVPRGVTPFHDKQISVLYRMLEDMLRVNVAYRPISAKGETIDCYTGLQLEKVHYIFHGENRGLELQGKFRAAMEIVEATCLSLPAAKTDSAQSLTKLPVNLLLARAGTVEYPLASPTLMFHVPEDEMKFEGRGFTPLRAERDDRWKFGFSTVPRYSRVAGSMFRIHVSWVILGQVKVHPHVVSATAPDLPRDKPDSIKGCYFLADDGSDCFFPSDDTHVCPLFMLECSTKPHRT